MRLDVPPPILRYAIAQGSIAIDGVSLTIAALHGDGVEVALIPHTLAVTTMGGLRSGSEVNLEADLIAKYVERLVPARSAPGGGTDGGPDDG
jgi:riboflavin synthase